MLRIHLTTQDALRVCFDRSPGPLVDVAQAARAALRADPGVPGVRRLRSFVSDPELRPLFALQPPYGFSAGFVAPRSIDLETGLATVRAQPADRIRHELAEIWPGARLRGWQTLLHEGDPRGLALVERAVRRFHRLAIDRIEPGVAVIRAADVTTRVEILGRHGLSAAVDGLHRSIRLRGTTLEIARDWDFDIRLEGQGVQFQPSPFLLDEVRVEHVEDSDHPLVISYPARARVAPPPKDSLARLLGSTRARVLEVAAVGSSTTEIASRVGISPSSASEHATALRAAGLLASNRVGSRMEHRLTELGAELLVSNLSDAMSRIR
ncbi:MAG TPA: winged helix-turn-helix domain-containing protein [Actinopolymorphaceae bacterium]